MLLLLLRLLLRLLLLFFAAADGGGGIAIVFFETYIYIYIHIYIYRYSSGISDYHISVVALLLVAGSCPDSSGVRELQDAKAHLLDELNP